jgi:hypothetical protein
MAEQAPPQELAAGWMRDPSGRHFGRYWDGKQWTDHVISAETVPGVDLVDQQGHAPGPASAGDAPGRWARDPYRRHASRYWDGERWTEHVMSAARVPSIDPVPQRSVEVIDAMPAPVSLGSPRPEAVPRRASDRRPAWRRSAPWAVAVIACGLVIIGIAITGDPPRPTQVQTNVTEPVATTAPSATTPLATTIPLVTQAPVAVPGAPADTGAPATTTATQPTVTRPPTADPPTTLAPPREPAADPSMTTT